MSDMPRPRPPFLQRETTRHGKVVWYFRRGDGPRIRMPGAYGSDEFRAAYEAAYADRPVPVPGKATKGSLLWLVDQYKRSAAFAGLAPTTRRVRDRILLALCKDRGGVSIGEINRAVIQGSIDKRAATPHAANSLLKTLRALLDHAVSMGEISTNPASQVKLLHKASDGHHTWTLDEVAAFERRHPVGTRARLAMDLILYTGLRRSDIVQIGRQHVSEGVLSIRPEKTKRTSGVEVTIRILRPLAESISASPTGDLHFLVTAYGEPFTVAGFGNWFRKRCDEAGVPGSAHGLRKASATRMAENGATAHELMAVFGWTSVKEAEIYTRAADRRRIALAAADKMHRPETSIPAPSHKVRGTGRKAK